VSDQATLFDSEQTTIKFFVAGDPASKGSMSGFPFFPKSGPWDKAWCPVCKRGSPRVTITDSSKRAKKWQKQVKAKARTVKPAALFQGPIAITCTFLMPRPKGHFGAHGVKPSAPKWPIKKHADTDKQMRVILDALTGEFYEDDSQVIELHAAKRFVDDNNSGVVVEATALDGAFEPF